MRILTLVCAILAVVAGTLSASLWRDLRAERAQVAGLNSRLTAAERRLADSMIAIRPPVVQAATKSTQPAHAEAPASQAPDLKSFQMNHQAPQDAQSRKARELAQILSGLPFSYPGLIQALGLAPDQAVRLFGLLAEYELERKGNPVSNVDGHIEPEALAERRRAEVEARRKLDESLTALLGESGVRQWQEYQRTIPSRQEGALLNKSMESLGLAFSDAQMSPLTAAIRAEQSRLDGEFEAQFGGGAAALDPVRVRQERFRLKAESDNRLVDAMAPHLNGQQLDALRADLERRRTTRFGDRTTK